MGFGAIISAIWEAIWGFIKVVFNILTYPVKVWVGIFVVLILGHLYLMHGKEVEWKEKAKAMVAANEKGWIDHIKKENDIWEGKLAAQKTDSDANAAKLKEELATAQEEARRKPKQVIKEVTKYVPAAVDFTVNVGFLRGYAEALGPAFQGDVLARISGRPELEGTGTHLSTVLATDAQNIGECKAAIAEVVTWRVWYVAQKDICEDSGVCKRE